ncbi:MAG: IS200/IS605 family element transposase accessory protein TnpB [Methylacidiphilales bacterium]|nr:IS200/IS605 family element transposase accessory protein TnpB [Candidatus Methylacidiphilales bacterium]NJR15422.1 IS200/IS605 family element transposase accessory protein TnpB [Calothrix sp. CSU_2_0]
MKARYQYRFYPTDQQQQSLSQLFGCVRVVWNDALAICKQSEKLPSNNDLQKLVITQAKKTIERDWLSEVSNIPLQQSVADLGVAYKNFFNSLKGKRKGKKLGSPNFKKKTNQQSARFRIGGFSIKKSGVYLAKIGNVNPIWSRELPASPSSVTVIKDCANRYFLSFVVDVEPLDTGCARCRSGGEPINIDAKNANFATGILRKSCEISGEELFFPEVSRHGDASLWQSLPGGKICQSIGIDLGIKTFAFMSNGEKAESPNYSRLDKRVRRKQKQLARQQRDSRRRNKTRIQIAKLHNKIADTRKDFLHKLSTKVVSENQTIVLEDLNVSGMVKNRKLSRAISQQGWREFRTLCEAKSQKYNREFVVINRWEPTSQVCSKCGYKWGKLDLKVRTVQCLNCGTEHDRDENAAKNINIVGMGNRHDSKRTQRQSKTTSVASVNEASRITAPSGR